MTASAPPIARIVAASCNRAWLVIMLAMLLSVIAGVFTARHFAMTTDSLQMISPDIPWRRNKAIYDAAFPHQNDLIVVVVDGATPELAEWGAEALAARLTAQPDLFRSVWRPDGGPFFARNGILLSSTDDVEAAMSGLVRAQPFLGPLAHDPSLRGLMTSLRLALEGVRRGQTNLEELDRPLRAYADSLEQVARGRPAFFSWRGLLAAQSLGTRETRRIILAQPRLEYEVLLPGARASSAIRLAARDLHLDQEAGVRVRLTGATPLADEEFATLGVGAGAMVAAMTIGALTMLWLAVRSLRMTACIVITTLIGLILTAAMGLLIFGRYNLISVAFIPLYVGLGVDFGIQFTVRYRAERRIHPDLRIALTEAGAGIGGSLALAAGAIAIGFLAFLPTAYRGASELGLTAGGGMVIAFLLSITLLPALLAVARPTGEAAEVGFAWLAPVDRFLLNRRAFVLSIGGLLAVGSLALLPSLQFDFNPLHLRSAAVKSMSTLIDLMSDPDRTPNTIDVLAPSLDEADRLALRLDMLPEVARTVTLSSFIPRDQKKKLELIDDASNLLYLTLDPMDIKSPPSDAEIVQSLSGAADALKQAAGNSATSSAAEARRLAALLDELARSSPTERARASQTLIWPFSLLIKQLRAMFQAEPVTLTTLPPELKRDWVSADGRARILVVPRGNSNDNRTLQRFAAAVRTVAPNATGTPISIQEAGRTIVSSFIEAGIWSFLGITILLGLVLRRIRDVAVALVPILLMGLLTLASCVLIDQPVNFANIIALPLLFGIGVAFNIYFVMAWRSGEVGLLQSSLARAILFSALTTATAFGSLALSAHPGTASLGRLLIISLLWTLVTISLFEPALLGRHRNL